MAAAPSPSFARRHLSSAVGVLVREEFIGAFIRNCPPFFEFCAIECASESFPEKQVAC